VKEHPILFSGAMVRAILAGAKTQTRRILTPEWLRCLDPEDDEDMSRILAQCPYGGPGDRLWVREGFAPRYHDDERAAWMADWTGAAADLVPRPKFKPGIHMPRLASRIDLEIEAVRVERLQSITGADIAAEGVTRDAALDLLAAKGIRRLDAGEAFAPREAWRIGWDAINGKRASWASNPWVWVITFRRVRP
jgi:hypothetical protein